MGLSIIAFLKSIWLNLTLDCLPIDHNKSK